jgi:ribonuclease HI
MNTSMHGESPSPGLEPQGQEAMDVSPSSSEVPSPSNLPSKNSPPPPPPPPQESRISWSLTILNPNLYHPQNWISAKEAMLAFVGCPNLSPVQVLDLLEQEYSQCPVGSIRVSKTHIGYMISSLSKQVGLSKLAESWAAKPLWPHALLIPMKGTKPAYPVLPLPALVIRQIPFGHVRKLLIQFDSNMTQFYESGDPMMFPAQARVELIRSVILSKAAFCDLRLLSSLKDNADESTPVSLVLYPASVKDFAVALESRTIINGAVYYPLPFAENTWMAMNGNFQGKDICQWCGVARHHPPLRCEVGDRFMQELEAHCISHMFSAYRVGSDTADRLKVPPSPPEITPLPVPSQATVRNPPSFLRKTPPVELSNSAPAQQSQQPTQPPTGQSPSSSPDAPPVETETSERPNKLQKANQTDPKKFTQPTLDKFFTGSPQLDEEKSSEEMNKQGHLHYPLFASLSTAGGGQNYRDAAIGLHKQPTESATTTSSPPQFLLRNTPWAFELAATEPDGNCFYHCLLHPLSPVRINLPGSTPIQLRHHIVAWYEDNRALGEYVIRRSFGPNVSSLLNTIRANYGWTDYSGILLGALALDIDICVMSPCDDLTMLTSQVLEAFGVPFAPRNGTTTILFHEYGVAPNNMNQSANHFSLLLLQTADPHSAVPSHQEILNRRTARRAPSIPSEPIVISDSDDPGLQLPSPPQGPGPEQVAEPLLQRTKTTPPRVKTTKTKTTPMAEPPPPPPCSADVGLNIFCWNANSLKADNRLLKLQDISKESDIDIFVIQECGLDQPPFFDGYNSEIAFGHIRPRGNLALIKANLTYTRRRDIEDLLQPIETIAIEIPHNNPLSSNNTLLVSCYFNPSQKLPPHTLVAGLEALEKTNLDIIFCGDFNSPCMAMRGHPPFTQRGTLLDEFLDRSNLTLISDFEFTFIRGDSVRSCLDGCITSPNLAAKCVTTLLHPLSPDHYPFIVSAEIECIRQEVTGLKSVHHQVIDKYTDWSSFFHTIMEILPPDHHFASQDDISTFVKAVQQAQTVAFQPKPSRLVNEGWWNDRCRQALKERNHALRRLQRCPVNGARKQALKKKYSLAKKSAQDVFKEERKKWKEWLINGAKNKPHQKIWGLIARFCGSKYKRKGMNGATMYGVKAQSKANELCQIFEATQNAPDLSAIPIERSKFNAAVRYIRPEPDIEEWEIEEALSRVQPGSAPGPDGIRVTTIRKLWTSNWKPCIIALMQAAFRQPDLFSCFKHAVVHPIPKPGNPDSFRPISLLSQLGKILERIVSSRLKTKLNIPNQFGCYPHRSSRDAIVRLQHWAVHAKRGAISIFFDITKAYDRVIPSRVLEKLCSIPGITSRLLKWIDFFLRDRSFQVRVNGFLSLYVAHPQFGLPQGSPLSVVLWQVFLIDLPLQEKDNLFMDDITFNIDEDTYEEAEEIANNRLTELYLWANRNGVIFDSNKTKVLPHESAVEVHLRAPDRYYLPLVRSYKYLGVWLAQRNLFDRGFSLHIQFGHDRDEFKRRLNWLKRLYGCPLYIRRTAYIALIRSKLCYGLLLTFRNYCDELEQLQTVALRTLCGALNSTPGTKLRQLLQLPTILAIAKSQATKLWGKMLAYGGLLTKEYEYWVTQHEGNFSRETPFGLVQTVSLVQEENLAFTGYSKIQRRWCQKLAQIHCYTSPAPASESLRLYFGRQPSHKDHNDRIIEGFCDGGFSKTERIGSSGFIAYEAGKVQTAEGSASYYPVFSSFASELLAFRDLLTLIRSSFAPDSTTTVKIYSDSASLIAGLKNWTRPVSHCISPTQAEVLDLIYMLRAKELILQWIPGHAGFPGNEVADTLASRALSLKRPVTIDVDLGFVDTRARNYLRESFSFTPCVAEGDFVAPMLSLQNKRVLKLLRSTPAITQKMITRLLTNHYNLKGCYFGQNLKKAGPTDPDPYMCRFCDLDIETSFHIVDRCKASSVTLQRASLISAIQSMSLRKVDKSLLISSLNQPSTWPALHAFFSNLNLVL